MGTKLHPGAFDCYEAAEDDEPMFILLARDEQAPERVEEWARKRFEQAAAQPRDREHDTRELRKIAEALQCANNMREWRFNKKAKEKLAEPPQYPWDRPA